MPKSDPTAAWTVPQAAAWIRARDLRTVATLDARQRVSLAILEGALPGAIEASRCLVEALRGGRPTARGRRAVRELDGTGRFRWRPLDHAPAWIPQDFWMSGGRFADDLHEGVTAQAPGALELWKDLQLDVDDCIGRWQPPEAILDSGRLMLSQALEQLAGEPQDHAAWLLGHPRVKATGIAASGERMAIDRHVFDGPFTIDGANNALASGDGRLAWSAVVLELAADGAVAGPRSSGRRRGAEPTKREAVVRWLRRTFPDGNISPMIKNTVLLERLLGDGLRVDARTLSRALAQLAEQDRDS